jgi:hypothetical protein
MSESALRDSPKPGLFGAFALDRRGPSPAGEGSRRAAADGGLWFRTERSVDAVLFPGGPTPGLRPDPPLQGREGALAFPKRRIARIESRGYSAAMGRCGFATFVRSISADHCAGCGSGSSASPMKRPNTQWKKRPTSSITR